MAIHPPEKRIWWSEFLERSEVTWIIIAFIWGLVMFFTMVFWHFTGERNLSNEAYRIHPETFAERTEAMIRSAKRATPVSRWSIRRREAMFTCWRATLEYDDYADHKDDYEALLNDIRDIVDVFDEGGYVDLQEDLGDQLET